ncbi:MAG TPA: AAA family ATPase [Brumimicrobium sp.]|nr:AAA family ATPase [Brumimicrobium sp.]
MLTYQEYEEAIYNWFNKKNEQDPDFTFSFRRVASKGAKADYFIGTEKSKYFGLTLWTIPVFYPGASTDLISLIFRTRQSGYKVEIALSHTKDPLEGQNQYALDLVHLIEENVKKSDIHIAKDTGTSNKNYGFKVSPSAKNKYEDIDKMLIDFDLLLKQFIPIVNEAIAETKKQHPDFVAHRITQEEFEEMKSSMIERRKKNITSEENQTNGDELTAYIDQLKRIIKKFNLKKGDPRIVFSTRKNRYNFIVGQRYAFVFDKNNAKGHFGVITNELISENYEQFEGEKSPAYLNFIDQHSLTSDVINKLESAIKLELESAIKSSFLKYNDTNFEQLIFPNTDTNTDMEFTTNSKHPLNQILYGPPGTGKTYFTKNTALEIIGLEPDNMDRVSIQKEFDKGLKDGRIVFTTFHQSMSYEDFIEGIKPVIDQKDDSDEGSNEEIVKYEIVDGIFKEACENAKVLKEFVNTDTPQFHIPEEVFKDKKFFKISLGNTLKDSGDIVYDFCKENNYISIGWGSDIDYTGVKSRKDIRTRLTSAGVEVGKMDFNISAIERFTLWMRKGDIVFASHGNRQLKAVGVITGEYEFKSSEDSPLTGYNHFRKVEWKILDAKIPVGKVYEKNFSQQSIYELYTKNVKPEFFTQSTPADTRINDNFVIIIDEINRGNVSQIFGELITLIEEDKRSGKDEALEVTLPYSKEKFSVPPNLYIIGTMNTADRSVEALDTALRRRFSFQEMMPNPELLSEERDNGKTEIEGINLEQLLRTINERIEVLVDRDHTIGHSYFLNVQSEEDLKDVFKDKVIPLLQEYFFGDYSKMEMVIGSYFFKKELPKVTFAVTNENYYEERKRYVFKDFDDADFDIITALKELLLIKEQVAVES